MHRLFMFLMYYFDFNMSASAALKLSGAGGAMLDLAKLLLIVVAIGYLLSDFANS